MATENISATVNKVTAQSVRDLAKKENRSFSKMVDILLAKALIAIKRKK